jgi:hypothetical protein
LFLSIESLSFDTLLACELFGSRCREYMKIRARFRVRLAASVVACSLTVASGRALAQSAPEDTLI